MVKSKWTFAFKKIRTFRSQDPFCNVPGGLSKERTCYQGHAIRDIRVEVDERPVTQPNDKLVPSAPLAKKWFTKMQTEGYDATVDAIQVYCDDIYLISVLMGACAFTVLTGEKSESRSNEKAREGTWFLKPHFGRLSGGADNFAGKTITTSSDIVLMLAMS